MKSHRQKEGFVRVCTEIENSVNETFAEYEKITARHINKSMVMKNALMAEYEKVKAEMNSLKKEI